MEMTHGSLFSGIGGFDLASEWIGWQNLFHCEWNEFGQKVLKHYWPNAELFTDIKKSNFTKYANKIDVLTGGFPCQPYSSAGKRLGKEDDRHLWPEMLRAIREIQPSYVVGENVRGLTNWNGGLVFDEVQADLEAEGYEVLPFLLPACAVNAPHRRDRIWFIAYSTSNGYKNRYKESRGEISKEDGVSKINRQEMGSRKFNGTDISRITSDTNCNGFNQCNSNNEIKSSERGIDAFSNFNESNDNGNVANTLCNGSGESRESRQSKQFDQNGIEGRNVTNNNSRGLEGSTEVGWDNEYAVGEDGTTAQTGNPTNTTNKRLERLRREERGFAELHNRRNENKYWQNFPTVAPVCNGDDGLSNRLDNITFPKWRNESIKAGGNAIVPQVAYQIFKAIQEIEKINKNL
jgi:DNA (cytosine-5)-methyltransferase 1